jgi:hypothetical protein
LLVAQLGDLMRHANTVVVTKKSQEYESALQALRGDQTVVDLIRAYADIGEAPRAYNALVG